MSSPPASPLPSPRLAQKHPDRAPLALIGVPFGFGAGAGGCELGAAAARLSGLVETLEAIGQPILDLGDIAGPKAPRPKAPRPKAPRPKPPGMGAIGNHVEQVSGWIGATHAAMFLALKSGSRPLLIGGDHSISMGSVSAAARYAAETGKKLALLWIDAHADFNTPETSPSGNLHGMSVAFLTGHPTLAGLLPDHDFPAVHAGDVTLIGARSIDADEKAAIAAAGIHCLDMRAIDEFGVCALMRQVLAGFDPARTHLHVSIDLDVIEPALAPGVGTPVAGGLSYREAHLIMEMLYESGLVCSAEFVELNPMLDHAGTTARLLVDLAASLFGKTISLAPSARLTRMAG